MLMKDVKRKNGGDDKMRGQHTTSSGLSKVRSLQMMDIEAAYLTGCSLR
jgi:hypothetical protein